MQRPEESTITYFISYSVASTSNNVQIWCHILNKRGGKPIGALNGTRAITFRAFQLV